MLEKDLTEKGASKDTENVETGALGVLEPEKKIGRSTSNSCYEIQALDTESNSNIPNKEPVKKSERSTSNSRYEKQALDTESSLKLTFYKLDGKLDFLNLILPKTIPNKGLRLKFERSTSNSCYENQALDTESNLNLTIYRLDGDLDFLNIILPARVKVDRSGTTGRPQNGSDQSSFPCPLSCWGEHLVVAGSVVYGWMESDCNERGTSN